MAKLLIWGHKTRSQEVIEILETLGGENVRDYAGDAPECVYSINEQGIIDLHGFTDIPFGTLFTLKGFFEKFPYKIGDKVLIKPYVGARQICEMKWDSNDNCIKYGIGVGEWFNVSQLQPYKEGNMERKIESFEILENYCADEVKIEFDPSKFKMVKKENGYYVVKKQPKYPKTYEECCDILTCCRYTKLKVSVMFPYDAETIPLLENIRKLLICRDAYWKMAGDWKPDRSDGSHKNCLINYDDKITKCAFTSANAILTFPTKEIRDAFYENFKELIESCKELL